MTAHLGKFTVRADGLSGRKATEYEATLMGMLRSFDQWQATKAVMRAVAFYNQPVLIRPYDDKSDPCNATGGDNQGGLQPNSVEISPQRFNGPSSCFPSGSAGASPHEILLHELVHAARSAAGVGTTGAYEEAVAITVANVYSSEMNRSLRAANAHHTMWPTNHTDPMVFMQHNTRFLSKFYHEMPELFRWIAEVNVKFNPVRLYYQTVLTGVARLNSA